MTKRFSIICSILLGIIIISSCSRDQRYAKILKKDYSANVAGYKQLSVAIVDTVFIYHLTDSIAALKGRIQSEEQKIERYQTHLQECQVNLQDAKRERRNTYYFLAGLYDSIIDKYEDLIQSAQDTIDNVRTRIHLDSLSINVLDSLITCTPADSITFYVAKHEYDCGGGVVSELVYFNQNDEIYKTKYYEE